MESSQSYQGGPGNAAIAREFTYSCEASKTSHMPHWTGGKSGVTIGPGYDLKMKTPEEVKRDFAMAGIPAATA